MDRETKKLLRHLRWENNKEHDKEVNRLYREANKAKIKEQRKIAKALKPPRKYELSEKQKQEARERTKQWKIINSAAVKANNAFRRAQKLRQTPSWASTDTILEIYKNCPENYHVDHIIPLKGENVCGLHIEYNLQYLSAEDNLRKGNTFENYS